MAGAAFHGLRTYLAHRLALFSSHTMSFTPLELMRLPLAGALRDEFVGRPLSALRTPALLIDRSVFAENCRLMGEKVEALGLRFRAHIKSASP